MVSRILQTARNPFAPEERFWLISTLIGESIHPGELGSFDHKEAATSIQCAREAAARKLGVPLEDILPDVSLTPYLASADHGSE